jgi:drug/metabolite transporter (DMT)-like permease
MLVGAVVQAVIGVAMDERLEQATVTSEAVGAVVYLAIFGSLLGFSAYGWLLRVEPATRVSTYAFVNPVVAVVLGAVVGGEPISSRLVLAMALILAAVVLIMRPSSTSAKPRR